MNHTVYENWSRLISVTLRIVGVLGIIGVPIFWAFTGRVELAFLPFFGTLAGVGQGLDVLREISQTGGTGGGATNTNEARTREATEDDANDTKLSRTREEPTDDVK